MKNFQKHTRFNKPKELSWLLYLVIGIAIGIVLVSALDKKEQDTYDKTERLNDLIAATKDIHSVCFANWCVHENMTLNELRTFLDVARTYPYYDGAVLTVYEQVCNLE